MSRTYERVASVIIGSPVQPVAERVRDLKHAWTIRQQPELRNVLTEGRLTRDLMRRYLTVDTNCVDVGCHLGAMLQDMVTLAPRGRHHAFEPVPYKAAWLEKKFPSVHVHQMALSDKHSIERFYVNQGSSAFSALRPAERSGQSEPIQVEVGRLDDVLPADLSVGFVKIDAIGGELAVMRGGEELLRRHRPIVLFEASETTLGYFDLSASEIHDYLVRELGYRLYSLHGWSVGAPPLELAGLEKAMQWPYEAFNFLALPPGR
jgi:FkbM family methyltransferase